MTEGRDADGGGDCDCDRGGGSGGGGISEACWFLGANVFLELNELSLVLLCGSGLGESI